jgi:rubredoxin
LDEARKIMKPLAYLWSLRILRASKESEEYRAGVLRRLEHKYRQSKPTEVLEAEKVVAKYRKEQEQAAPQIARLNQPLPEDNLCPECWFMHGQRSMLYAVSHPTDSDRFDRMRCRTCGHVEDREFPR